jgi:TonB family protein
MRLLIASSALAAAFVLAPLAVGYAPALCQDFSITNQVEPAKTPWQGEVMRELQTWWNAHAYYPRHASNNDEAGTVKVRLAIHPDGKIWTVNVVASSGSPSLDAAGDSVFRGGSVRPSSVAGEPNAEFDISLHYVLAHRHDQPETAGYTPMASKGPFTITNDPVKSPILETMLQKTCTGTEVIGGIPNYPIFGMHSWAQAVFFRKPDGTPWVKFYEQGYPSLSPVTQVGKMVTWTGRQRSFGPNAGSNSYWLQYTVWPDGDNHLSGAIGIRMITQAGVAFNRNLAGNYVDLTCATEVLPTVTWNEGLAQSKVQSPVDLSSSDPP